MSKIKTVKTKRKAKRLMKKGWKLISKETKEKYTCCGDGHHEGYEDVDVYTLAKQK